MWKNRSRTIKYGILLVCLLLISILLPIKTMAAKDVTNSVKGKKKIVKLVKRFEPACIYGIPYNRKKISFDFSKAKDRKTVLECVALYSPKGYASSAELKKWSKQLFGKATSMKHVDIYDMEGMPNYKKLTIYRLSSSKFRVATKVYEYDDIDGRNYYCGKASFIIKRKKGSYYGYVVTKMTINK